MKDKGGGREGNEMEKERFIQTEIKVEWAKKHIKVERMPCLNMHFFLVGRRFSEQTKTLIILLHN